MTKKSSTRGAIQNIPWWLYLLFAIMSYTILKYIVPLVATAKPGTFVSLSVEAAAPIVAILFLLLAATALYRDDPPANKDEENRDKNNTPE